MKKLVLGVLLVALLVFSVPVTVAAAPEQSNTHKVSGEISAMAVDRQVATWSIDPATGIATMTGIAIYAGTVATANGGAWSSLKGAKVTATEQFSYQYYAATGAILPGKGKVTGSLTMDVEKGRSVTMGFKADVWGNIASGPAGDNGDWKVTKTVGHPYESIDNSQGSWTAVMNLVTVAPGVTTFAGTVKFAGTYKGED